MRAIAPPGRWGRAQRAAAAAPRGGRPAAGQRRCRAAAQRRLPLRRPLRRALRQRLRTGRGAVVGDRRRAGAPDRRRDPRRCHRAVRTVARRRRPGLIEAIEERLAVDVQNEAIYLLIDAGGRAPGRQPRPRAAPARRRRPGGAPAWSMRGAGGGAAACRDLGRRCRLLIGRDETERQQLQTLLTEGVIWASSAVMSSRSSAPGCCAWCCSSACARPSRPSPRSPAATCRSACRDVRARRRVRPARRDHEPHAGPHRHADGGGARRLGRHRARPAHTDRPRPRQAGGGAGRRPTGRARRCARRSSRGSPTSTTSAASSRRCCASPRPRPAPAARPSRRSTCPPCWRTRPRCTRRRPRRVGSD